MSNNKKLNWFFCLNENRAGAFLEMAMVAVLSAVPYDFNMYCLYDGDNEKFVSFLESHGVHVIQHESSFKSKITELVAAQSHKTYYGAFLRIDIPLVIRELGLDIDHYFYTDCDVVFTRDPRDFLNSYTPETIAATGETKKDEMDFFNSGVMWCNTVGMLDTYQAFYDFVVFHEFKFTATDQGALNAFYKHQKIQDEINWKPYWGINEDAYLVHFHGPKPYHVKQYLNDGEQLTDANLKQHYGALLNDNNIRSYKYYLRQYNILLRKMY